MLSGGYEFQRHRIDAVSQSRRLRTIVEDVTEMRAAAFAKDLGPRFAETIVHLILDILPLNDLEKTRPTGTGIELMLRAKQMQTARTACVYSWFLVVGQLAGIRALGALLSKNVKRFGRKNLPPL